MTSALQAEIESAITELANTRRAADELRRHAAESSYTERARSRLFTVTVSGRGELTDISFVGDGYRKLAPAELARTLVDTVEQARRNARDEAASLVNASLPDGSARVSFDGSGRSFDDTIKRLMSRDDVSEDRLRQAERSWDSAGPAASDHHSSKE